MKKEYIFSDLEKIVAEKDLTSSELKSDKWQVFDYETGKVSGKMLTIPEMAFPKNLTLDINLTGVYNIYICIPKLRLGNVLYIKLSDELFFTGVKSAMEKERPQSWGIEEYMEEIYWKTADLTGKSIVIGKRDSEEAVGVYKEIVFTHDGIEMTVTTEYSEL